MHGLVCVGAVGLPAQKGFGLSSQQDDDLPMDDSSEGDINSDSPSSEVVGGDSKQRKKKKTKSYQGLSFYDVGKSVKVIYRYVHIIAWCLGISAI